MTDRLQYFARSFLREARSRIRTGSVSSVCPGNPSTGWDLSPVNRPLPRIEEVA